MTSLATQLVTGDKRTITVRDIVNLYKSIHNISLPSRGKIQRLGENAYSIINYFQTTDCDTLESVRTFKVYSLKTKDSGENSGYIESVRCISDIHEVNEVASVTSDNGRYLARLKSNDNKQELLEIWDRNKLVKTLNISELDVHGSINIDPMFSSLVWSPFGNQDKLLYVCQSKRPKSVSYFKELPPKVNSSPDDQNQDKRGEEFVKREDWGECLAGIEHTIVAILDVANNCQITTIDVKDYSLGQSLWLDNGTKVVSVAYKESPRRLGLLHCNNKPSKIVVHDWQSSGENMILELESDSECYHSPRVNNTGDKFLYLKNSVYGPHRHSVQANIYDFVARTSETLIDQATPKSDLFIEDLPKNCFTSDDKHIVFVGADHLYHHLCLFSLESSNLSKIKFPTTGVSIMDFRYDVILAAGSEINATPTLFVSKLNTSNMSDVVAWYQIEDCLHLEEITHEAYKIPSPDGSSFISACLVKPELGTVRQNHDSKVNGPSTTNSLPTIVRVHGGPHSAYNIEYIPNLIFYSRLGIQNLLINYRGSSGVSEEYLRTLGGKVGEVDVGDCMHVIRHLVEEKLIDPSNLIIEGGSHGGFITAHLCCQEEFKFTCAILRNPVIDMTTVYATSDIPEWCFYEVLGHESYDSSSIPTNEDLIKLYGSSPMSRVEKVIVPTLMLLGNKDLRVPMFQGQRWVDNLKSRGIETLCKVYPDGHSLSKPSVAADVNVTMATWILSHLPDN